MKDELLAKMLSGDASREEAAALAAELSADPAFASSAADLAAIEAMLGVAAEDELSVERRVRQTMIFLRERERDDFVQEVRFRLGARRRWVRGLSAAAAVLALMASGWFYHSTRPIGTLVRAETVTWSDGLALEEGADLKRGSRISFETGLLEIKTAHQDTLIIEGPAEVELPLKDRAVIHRGRVVVQGAATGKALNVVTPLGSVDHGSEFAVYVSERDEVETHALEGDLEFSPSQGEKVVVSKGKALHADAQGNVTVSTDSPSFYTALPPRAGSGAPFVHWSMDEGRGVRVADVSRGLGAGPKKLDLRSIKGGSLPRWIDGRYGKGLEFDGAGAFAESGFRGISGGDPRTVCFWVKVPRDLSLEEAYGIVSWGRFNPANPGGVWQISINPVEGDGPVGRIRVGAHVGQVVGSTDLRDGEWHHVGVVLYGGSPSNIGTHVMVYLDGKLEAISQRTLREVRTDVETADHGVWIGRNIDPSRRSPENAGGGFFRGAVDEVYIFSGALSQPEVLELMEKNQPPR